MGRRTSACREAVHILALSYRRLAATLARTPVVELARYQVHRLETRLRRCPAALQKAQRETPLVYTQAVLQKKKKGKQQFRNDPAAAYTAAIRAGTRWCSQALVPIAAASCRSAAISSINSVPVGVAFKVVGIGSVGLRDYWSTCEGNGERRSALPSDKGRARFSLRAIHRSSWCGESRSNPSRPARCGRPAGDAVAV